MRLSSIELERRGQPSYALGSGNRGAYGSSGCVRVTGSGDVYL
jgi:hypothetical protein